MKPACSVANTNTLWVAARQKCRLGELSVRLRCVLGRRGQEEAAALGRADIVMGDSVSVLGDMWQVTSPGW